MIATLLLIVCVETPTPRHAQPEIAWGLASVPGTSPVVGAVPGEGDEAPTCRKCGSTGRQPCPEHRKDECALEDGVLYCSVVADCAECGGAGFVDCPKCDNASSDARLEARRASSRAGAARWVELDEQMGRPLRKAETEHFLLVWEMGSMKVEKKRLDEHELLHLYAGRLEEIYDLYLETLGAKEEEFGDKMQVFVWAFGFDQIEGSLRFCRQSGEGGVRLLGAEPRYSVNGSREFFQGDEALHRNLAHNVAQILFSHQLPIAWVGNKKGGWAEEGLAHWFEDHFYGICDSYCFEEQNANRSFKSGKYKLEVRKMVARDAQPPIALILEQNTDTLTLAMHPVVMSYVDYLIQEDGAKFGQLGALMRAGKSSRDALKEVYGLNPLTFEERWKEWVLATYPTR